jgi:diaminohydroxyphosphoribosylaminopyrimidine deaminase/5-amino-6-(5-phosphoribosylamino)uracil reductase
MPNPRHSAVDREHMSRALALAARGLFTTTPNPRVGCVVAVGGDVIGEGFHNHPGAAHAEAEALADARRRGNDPRGATLYVTLEPCNHHGRTPPCSEAVIAAGIARVVAAMPDPNPVAAGGSAKLASAGIAVDVGLCEDEARELNIGFVSRMTRGRPWVRSKIAASLDGRTALANGSSQWITGPAARADGHAWRARACAILTGVGTVLQDDPALTVRDVPTPRQPRIVVVDRHGDTPPQARVLEGGRTLVVTANGRNPAWPDGIECITLPDPQRRVDLDALMRALGERGINELHVEAGAKLNGALVAAGLIDEYVVYVAPSLLGEPARGMVERSQPLADLAARVHLDFRSVDRIGDDLRIVARVMGDRA